MCDFDIPEFYRTSQPIARKKHKCYECDREINPGEKYEYVVALWLCYHKNRQIDIFKTCSKCISIRKSLQSIHGDECFEHGGLWEDVVNTFDNLEEREQFLAKFK